MDKREETEFVRILSGINSINFDAGYDPKTGIFDKRKTDMGAPETIFCFTDGNGTRPDINDEVTRTVIDYADPPIGTFPGTTERYIMSGLVKKSDLGPGNFSYVIGPVLNVDRLYRHINWAFMFKKIVDISHKLRK